MSEDKCDCESFGAPATLTVQNLDLPTPTEVVIGDARFVPVEQLAAAESKVAELAEIYAHLRGKCPPSPRCVVEYVRGLEDRVDEAAELLEEARETLEKVPVRSPADALWAFGLPEWHSSANAWLARRQGRGTETT